MAELKIKADSGGGTVSLKGPSTTTSNAAVQLTLPVDDGSADQYLKTDGSGALSWATVSAGAGGATALSLNDGVKVNFGSDDDLRISGGSGNSIIQHQDTAAGDLYIDAENSNIYIRSGDGSTGEENAIVCENNGKVKLYHSGTHVAETSANGLAFPSGKGIDFSADASNAGMDNELLDDYEEGYFTFTMDSENGDAWTSRSGYTKMRYVKIGNMVTFSGKYETNSTGGSPSGRLQITGLPFASVAATSDANNTRAFHGYIKGMSSDSNMVMHLWWMGSNSTTLLAHSFSNDNNGDMQSFTTSELATTTVWEGDVTGTYFTS